jgi:hypothetical protein
MRTDDEIKEWLAIREREALKDADTAEVTWSYCYFPDSYDVDEDLQEEERVVGRVYVARRPVASYPRTSAMTCSAHASNAARFSAAHSWRW